MDKSHFVQTLLLIGLSLLFSTGCKSDSPALTQAQEDALIPTIERFNNAFAQSDLVTLDGLVTDDYIHTNSTSKAITKESWFQYLNKRDKEIQTGTLVIKTYEMSDLNVEYHANSAIVTGKVSIMYTKEGKSAENEYRITNVWVFQDEGWKRAGFHDGKIK
ncbi:MAG: nuclear transport factor 2 family protein [Allomuricauda sp.]